MPTSGINSYVKALLDIAKETNKTKKFIQVANQLLRTIELEPLFLDYLCDRNITNVEKQKLLLTAYGKDADFLIKGILLFIKEKNGRSLSLLLKAMISNYNDEQNIREGTIWTTIKLTSVEIKKFEVLLTKKLTKKVSLTNKINQKILGGVIIEIDDLVWNNSILGKITALTSGLLGEK
ncbi:MAG: ATP synthase F1 subunit delta [Mycoplasmataceae bacterium]|nr:ATP synthase F1 subunit delta [Mycoplasmataceae bacterium]